MGTYGGKIACNFLDEYIDLSMLDNNLIEEFKKVTYNLQINSDYTNQYNQYNKNSYAS